MEIAYIILGWLFGILSPSVIRKISNQHKKKKIENIILVDLKDVKKRLAMLQFNIFLRYGKLTKKGFEWTKDQMKVYRKSEIDFNYQEQYEKITKTEDNLNDFLELGDKQGLKEKISFGTNSIRMNIGESKLFNLELLDDEFLENLFEIKFKINMFNDEVKNVEWFVRKTFDSGVSSDNYSIILMEIERKNLLLANQSISIVDKINLLNKYKKNN